MLPFTPYGDRGPLLVMLHWLGGGAQTWTELARLLAARDVRSAAIDLPGFGHAAGITGYSVEAMAEAVLATLRTVEPGPWLLAGHSMGGKVASLVARRVLDSNPAAPDLRGLILVSPSPPSPEPMPGNKRQQLVDSLGAPTGDPAEDRKHAAQFVDDNTGKNPIPESIRDRAVDGVLAMSHTALRHWLNSGSREDLSASVASLPLPALIFAGTEDAALGPEAQRTHTLPHLPHATLVALEGCGHLAPLERPGELVEHIVPFLASLNLELPTPQPALSPPFDRLLHSGRVSPTTRRVLEQRLQDSRNWNATPAALDPAAFRILRALVDRVVPDAGFDIAALVDQQLFRNKEDGWRQNDLPADPEAWRIGLLSLNAAAHRDHAVTFIALHPDQQDALLRQSAEGKLSPGLLASLHLGSSSGAFTAAQMQLWFEDARAVITRLYVADPRTFERIGFTGFADDLGFTQIQLGQREDFDR